MPLFKTIWNLATDEALYKGAFIVVADDAEHAIERGKVALGKEGDAANWRVEGCEGQCYELGRNTIPSDTSASKPLPSLGSPELFAFELAARANVVAASEEIAFQRFAQSVRNRESDGKYCKLLKTAILEKESMEGMSAFERNTLAKSFQRVQGGGVSPR